MRFNDLLSTVLASQGTGAYAAVTRWRQCVDLLAQMGDIGPLEDGDQATLTARLEELRGIVSPSQRLASVMELGSHNRSPLLVAFFAKDQPPVTAAAMAHARLRDEAWAGLIPTLGPLARSVLRRREDLGPQARRALAAFGQIDMALPLLRAEDAPAADWEMLLDQPAPEEEPAVVAQAAPSPEPSEISRIVDRIAEFRNTRGHQPEAVAPEPAEDAGPPPDLVSKQFQFTTDAWGVMIAVRGVSRSAAIGLTIGVPRLDGLGGADGQGLGAFRRRAAFRDARFVIPEGHLAGEWRMSAEPQFHSGTGRFTGYAGTARPALAHELSVQGPGETAGWGNLSATTARQLIHELRTPLNAIQGFAEIIEKQLYGPVSAEYREMAERIVMDARQLAATFDDLDLASRLVRGDAANDDARLDLAGLLDRALAQFDGEGGARSFVIAAGEELPPIRMDGAQAERMLLHLVRTLAAARGVDETLEGTLDTTPEGKHVELSLALPAALRGWTEDALGDQGACVDEALEQGSPLGAAFSLRLVRGLAVHSGGRMILRDGRIRLSLPAAGDRSATAEA